MITFSCNNKPAHYFNFLMVTSLLTLFSTNTSASDLSAFEAFSFHGYTRLNLSMSENGSTAARYIVPGAAAKYRLGNEPDTLIRVQLHYNNEKAETKEPYIQAVVSAQAYQTNGSSDSLSFNKIPKAYIKFGNHLSEDVSFWLGRRWYDRKGSYINDYWWLNTGQWANIGMGVEGVKLLNGEFKAAMFRHEDTDVTNAININNSTGTLNSTTLDLRLIDISVTDTSFINFWAFSALRHENQALGYDNETGFGIAAWLDTKDLLGGKNALAVTYKTGAAIQKSTYSSTPVNETMGYDLSKASLWEINNTWTWDDFDNYSIQWFTLFRSENHGKDGVTGDTIQWVTTGARPVFYLNRYLSIATEIGFDYVDNEILGAAGDLSKFSVALQLSEGKGFMNRPTLRIFATYAAWGDEWIGYIGNSPNDAPYGDTNKGWSIGAQVEHIW